MDRQKLSYVLHHFKNKGTDKVYETFCLAAHNLMAKKNPSFGEKLIMEALCTESKEFADKLEKFHLCLKSVFQIDGNLVLNMGSIEEQIYITAIYLESELRNLATKQAFEYGVEYGKILAVI